MTYYIKEVDFHRTIHKVNAIPNTKNQTEFYSSRKFIENIVHTKNPCVF